MIRTDDNDLYRTIFDFPNRVIDSNPGGHRPPPYTSTGTTQRANDPRMVTISFTIAEEFGPSLRSAVEEISNEVGGRLEGSFSFAQEQALTDAAVALAELRVAVFAKIPRGNPHYIVG